MKPIWDRLNVEQLLTEVVAWLPRLLSAITVFVVFWVILRVTRPALARILPRAGFDRALGDMLFNVYRFTILTFGVIMAANQLGVNVAAALAGLGVVGLRLDSPRKTRSAISWRGSSSSGTSRFIPMTGSLWARTTAKSPKLRCVRHDC